MVRTREFDPGAALDNAMQVFATRGYSNTSIDDVVKATGVSRYGLYGTFGNKRELFEKSLEKYTEHMGKAAFMRLLDPDASLADVRHTFEDRIAHLFSAAHRNGCLVVLTSMEMAPRDKEIQEVVHGLMRRMSKAYSVGLQNAQRKGEVREDLDLAQAGQFLTGAFFGMSVLASAGFSEEALHQYVDSTMSAVTD